MNNIGNLKLAKCGHCKEPTTNRYGLTSACNPEHALAIARARREKKERKALREDRKQTRADKARIKTRGELMKLAQASFNSYVRARAIRFGHTCISSGRSLTQGAVGGGFDCGHFRSIGSAPHLRFNLNNAWGQSKHDNQYKSGAVQAYRIGLIARIGLDKVEALENNNDCRKFDCEYLIRIAKIFRRKKRSIDKWHERNSLGASAR